MGLDDAEIIMDLEDRFHVSIDTEEKFDGTIEWLVAHITGKFTKEYFDKQIDRITGYVFSDANNISRSEYNLFASYMGWPRASWFNPSMNPGSKSKILYVFKGSINQLDFTTNVKEEVKRIIAERLNYKGVIKDSHNIYKDLGAG